MSATMRDRIAKIIAEQAMVDPGEVTDTTTMEELGLDSLGLVEVVFGIEEEFDITIPYNANDPSDSDFDLSNFGSVAKAVEALVARKASE